MADFYPSDFENSPKRGDPMPYGRKNRPKMSDNELKEYQRNKARDSRRYGYSVLSHGPDLDNMKVKHKVRTQKKKQSLPSIIDREQKKKRDNYKKALWVARRARQKIRKKYRY